MMWRYDNAECSGCVCGGAWRIYCLKHSCILCNGHVFPLFIALHCFHISALCTETNLG